jgi:hypothetical protein
MYSVRTSDPRRTAALLNRADLAKRAALFGDTVHITFEDRELDWPNAESMLRANHIEVLEAKPAEPSLEDVFIELVVSQGDRDG